MWKRQLLRLQENLHCTRLDDVSEGVFSLGSGASPGGRAEAWREVSLCSAEKWLGPGQEGESDFVFVSGTSWGITTTMGHFVVWSTAKSYHEGNFEKTG